MTAFAHYPSLKNRLVLITGGASGIGAALVEHFHAQGSRVVFLDKDRENANRLVSKLSHADSPAPRFFYCDLSDISQLKTVITEVIASMGNIAVLINNAGNDERHETLQLDEKQWRDIQAINLDQQFFAAQSVLPGMIKNGGGAIINMSSVCFLSATDHYIGYSAAKAAIIGLTHSLAKEFGAYNIRVNSILPGWVMTTKQVERWLTPEAEVELLNAQSLKQKLMPEDIARAALFLAADDSRMITKLNMIIDGGY